MMQKSNITFLRDLHRSGFTVVSNVIINDSGLSFRARGILLYLLSLPEDWYLYKSKLYEVSSDGRTAVDSALNELEERGYIAVSETCSGRKTMLRFTVSEKGGLASCAVPEQEGMVSSADSVQGVCMIPAHGCAENVQVPNTEPNTELPTTERKEGSSTFIDHVRNFTEASLGIFLSDDFYDRLEVFAVREGLDAEGTCTYIRWLRDANIKTARKIDSFIYSMATRQNMISSYRKQTESGRAAVRDEGEPPVMKCRKCGKVQGYSEKITGYCFGCGTQHYDYMAQDRKACNE